MSAWIDLYSNNTFTNSQLKKRYDLEMQRLFPSHKEKAMNRKNVGASQGKYVLNQNDIDDETAFDNLAQTLLGEIAQAEIDNQLLIDTIIYEKAKIRLNKYILSEGVVAVDEIPEIIDEESGEIIQEYEPAIQYIAPLPTSIEQNTFDENGNPTGTEMISNPIIVEDENQRNEAQSVIDNANIEAIDLYNLRKNN
jgi:hypothetical protein